MGARAEKSRRMTADAVKMKGLTLSKTLDADLDGDGKRETVGVCTGPKGVQLALIGEDADGAVVTFVSPPVGGQDLAKAEVKSLVPPKGSQQIIVEVYDQTPDEKVKRVRVYSGSSKELHDVFTSKIERAKNADERPEWENDKDLVSYGDARPGWYFEDLENDGITEIAVRTNKPQILKIAKDGGGEVHLLTGVYETIYRWNVDKATYEATQSRLNDFLPAYQIKDVAASSAWVDPKVLKDLKAQALSDALQNATTKSNDDASTAAAKDAKDPKKGDTKAASTKKDAKKDGKKNDAPVVDEPQIDLSPFIKPAADGHLETAWIADNNGGKTDGKGEWVDVMLEEQQAIHMVRLVLGCVDTKQSFQGHNVPVSFSLQLDNGGTYEVNRRKAGHFDGQVQAFTDLQLHKDRPWVKTTLVFFDGKTEAKKVRVILGDSAHQGRGNQTCISEVSVH
jgi:hypothetical protein